MAARSERSRPPQRREGGSWREELRPTGTDDVQCGATRRPDGARAAGGRQSWSVTWLPLCRCWPCRFWRARQVRQSTLHFLLPRSLADKEEEEEEKRKSGDRLAGGGVAAGVLGARKRKKRRKKKPPRTSFSFGRAHRRLQQWYVHGWLSWCCSSRCVLSFGRQAQDATLGPLIQKDSISVACAWLVLLVMPPSRCVAFIVGRPCVAFLGQVALARRCATTGAGSGPDSTLRCPWRLHRPSFWTRLWSFRHVPWSRQCNTV